MKFFTPLCPSPLSSGPCPPTDVDVSLQCVGSVGHVTWTAALLADLYVATVLSSAADLHNHNCTSNGTGCSLTELRCGETAAVTVVTVQRGCTSEPSPPFTFQSGQRPRARILKDEFNIIVQLLFFFFFFLAES